MNHIYKVIWNKAKHCYVVASEIAKSTGKSASAGKKALVCAALAAAALTGMGGTVWADDNVATPAAANPKTSQYVVVGTLYENGQAKVAGETTNTQNKIYGVGSTSTQDNITYKVTKVTSADGSVTGYYWVREGYTAQIVTNERFSYDYTDSQGNKHHEPLTSNTIYVYKGKGASDTNLLQTFANNKQTAKPKLNVTNNSLHELGVDLFTGASSSVARMEDLSQVVLVDDAGNKITDSNRMEYVQVGTDPTGLTYDSTTGVFRYNGTVVAPDYVYALSTDANDGDNPADSKFAVGVITVDGKLYTNNVYGDNNEIVKTAIDSEGNYRSYWAAETNDPSATLDKMPLSTYQETLKAIHEDDVNLAEEDIKEVKLEPGVDEHSGTISLLRNTSYDENGNPSGAEAVAGAITVSAGGGTNVDNTIDGNDTYVKLTNVNGDNTATVTLPTGSKVRITGSGTAATAGSGTIKTWTVNVNGTDYAITDTDTDTTYSAGTGLTLVGTTFSNNLSVAKDNDQTDGTTGEWTLTDTSKDGETTTTNTYKNTVLSRTVTSSDEVTNDRTEEGEKVVYGKSYTIKDTAGNEAKISDVASASTLKKVSEQVNTNTTNISNNSTAIEILQGLVWTPQASGTDVALKTVGEGDSEKKVVNFSGTGSVSVSSTEAGEIVINGTDKDTTYSEGTAISIDTTSQNKISVKYDGSTINVNGDGKLYVDMTGVESGAKLSYKVTNNGTSTEGTAVTLSEGLNFVGDTYITTGVDDNGQVTFALNTSSLKTVVNEKHVATNKEVNSDASKNAYKVEIENGVGVVKLKYADADGKVSESTDDIATISGIAVVYDGKAFLGGNGNLISTNSTGANDILGRSIALGSKTQASGFDSTVVGTNSKVTVSDNPTKYQYNQYLYAIQGTASTVYGAENTVDTSNGQVYSGVAVNVSGAGNTVTNSNGVVVQGTGNTITNAYKDMNMTQEDAKEIYKGDYSSLQDEGKDSGAVAVIGGANVIGGAEKGQETTYATVIGFQNKLIGSENVFTAGSHNTTLEYLEDSIILGNDIENIKGNSSEDKLTGVISIGNSNEVASDADFAVAIGDGAKVEKEGGVALGASSIASRGAGEEVGYHETSWNISEADLAGSTWKSTAAAVSVGGGKTEDGKTITRQITNVAAGSADTDAVNVAQLKKAVKAAESVASSQTFGLTDEDGNSITKKVGNTIDVVGDNNAITTSVTGTGDSAKLQIALKDDFTLGGDTSAGDTGSINVNGSAGNITASGTIQADTFKTEDGISIGKQTVTYKDEDGNEVTSTEGKNSVIGLENTSLDVEGFAQVGRAATEEQLKQVISDTETKVKAATTEVVKGNNVTVEKVEPQATDGHTTYKINAYDTKLTAGTNVSITGGDLDEKTGVRDYTVSLKDDVTITNIKSTTINTTNAYVTNVDETNDNSVINKKYFETNSKNITPGTYEVKDNKVTMTYQNGKGETISDMAVITNVASKSELDVTNQNVYNNYVAINQISGNIGRLSNRVDRVGAGAAALAALHPLDFDPDAKWDFAAGYGNYHGANAVAVGAYYRPNEDLMFSVGGSMGGGENMVNAGVSVKIGAGSSHVNNSKVAMAKEIKDLRAELEALKSAVLDGQAGRKIDTSKLQLFPDVPQNHWAYEYVAQLAGNGIIEGYPDGTFDGARPMTRYEFAAMLYRAMLGGAVLSDEILNEFAPELERFTVDTIHTDKEGNPTVERVRVAKPAKGAAE